MKFWKTNKEKIRFLEAQMKSLEKDKKKCQNEKDAAEGLLEEVQCGLKELLEKF
jgi:hypothetical protein